MRTIVSVLVLLVCCGDVYAADCGPQDYEADKDPDYDCPGPDENYVVPKLEYRPAVTIEKGATASFSGLVLEQNQVLQLGLRIKGLRRLRYLDTQKAAKTHLAEMDLQKKLSAADTKLVEAQRDNYKEQAVQLQKDLVSERAWYRSWTFGFVLGALITTTAAVSLAVSVK